MKRFSRKVRRDKAFLKFSRLAAALSEEEIVGVAVLTGVDLATTDIDGKKVRKDKNTLLIESMDGFKDLNNKQKKTLLSILNEAVNGEEGTYVRTEDSKEESSLN